MTRELGALDDRTEQKLARRAAKAAARRAERAEREDEERRRRVAKLEDRRRARAVRAQRRSEQAAALATIARRLRPVAPLLAVTGFAVYGQIGYGFEHYSPPGSPFVLRLLVAIGAAIAVESIALTVQWHAHDALLHEATATAARLRRASYLIAAGVAAVNYAHFADGWRPTAGAVVFALFSASSPWLWGLHTRRAQRLQLLREGRVDSTGAVFSAERFRAFPWRTFQARRYSIDHGITDPQVAWEAYRLERQRRHDDLPAAWQQLALSLLRLEDAQDQAEWAANMVSPIDVPELERVEDNVVTGLRQLDEQDAEAPAPAPKPTAPALRRPRRRPARRTTRAAGPRSTVLADPPQAAIDLVRTSNVGHKRLREQLLDEHHVEIGEYEAKELIKRYRTEVTP
jgi:hypothetical protein